VLLVILESLITWHEADSWSSKGKVSNLAGSVGLWLWLVRLGIAWSQGWSQRVPFYDESACFWLHIMSCSARISRYYYYDYDYCYLFLLLILLWPSSLLLIMQLFIVCTYSR